MKCNLCENTGNCYQEKCYNQMQTVCDDFKQNVIGKPVYYIQKYFDDATLNTYRKVKTSLFDFVSKTIVEVNCGTLLNYDNIFLTQEEAEQALKGGNDNA